MPLSCAFSVVSLSTDALKCWEKHQWEIIVVNCSLELLPFNLPVAVCRYFIPPLFLSDFLSRLYRYDAVIHSAPTRWKNLSGIIYVTRAKRGMIHKRRAHSLYGREWCNKAPKFLRIIAQICTHCELWKRSYGRIDFTLVLHPPLSVR